jgi:hypothetical protein
MSSKRIEINEKMLVDFSLEIDIKELIIWGNTNQIEKVIENSVNQFKEEIKSDLLHKLEQETEFGTAGFDRITFELNQKKMSEKYKDKMNKCITLFDALTDDERIIVMDGYNSSTGKKDNTPKLKPKEDEKDN